MVLRRGFRMSDFGFWVALRTGGRVGGDALRSGCRSPESPRGVRFAVLQGTRPAAVATAAPLAPTAPTRGLCYNCTKNILLSGNCKFLFCRFLFCLDSRLAPRLMRFYPLHTVLAIVRLQ